MVEGYRDGRNPDNSEPSQNRSNSYTQTFADERGGYARARRTTAEMLRLSADKAIRDDIWSSTGGRPPRWPASFWLDEWHLRRRSPESALVALGSRLHGLDLDAGKGIDLKLQRVEHVGGDGSGAASQTSRAAFGAIPWESLQSRNMRRGGAAPSCQVPGDLGCHEVHEQPRAERWCSAESVEEMQGYALKLSLRQDNLQVSGVDIRFDRTAQEVSDANTIERSYPQREAAVEIEATFGGNGLAVHEVDRKGPAPEHVPDMRRSA